MFQRGPARGNYRAGSHHALYLLSQFYVFRGARYHYPAGISPGQFIRQLSVRRGYLDLAAREPQRIRVLDASLPAESIASEILAELERAGHL